MVLAAAIDGTILLAGLPVSLLNYWATHEFVKMCLIDLQIVMIKLKGNTTQAIWISTSYHLASSVFQPAFVSISFIFGRKPVVAVAVFLAVAGSVVGGIAPNSTVLIIGKVLQGAGGGATTALAEIITSDLIPAEFKGRWLMILNVVWSVGTASGPVIGGWLAGTELWVCCIVPALRGFKANGLCRD